jgi:hypothetical protein
MTLKKTHAAAFCAALALGGCSFASDALFPSLTGGDPKGSQASGSAPMVSAGGGAVSSSASSSGEQPVALGTSTFEPVAVTPGASTGTAVGNKVGMLRQDLQGLQSAISGYNNRLQQVRNETIQDSARYHGTVAAMNARLQVGTTPGNPVLTQQWTAAQQELERINLDVAKMNQLANEVGGTAQTAVYIGDAVRATRALSGAVDEDHRQLRILEDETNRTVVTIERLLTELSGDIGRQQQYVAAESGNLNVLSIAVKNGQLYGGSLGNRNLAIGSQLASAGAPDYGAAPAGNRPLMVIRFDRPNVAYEQSLYGSVKSALERKPNASFEVMAISPSAGSVGQSTLGANTARRNAEHVARTLTDMGLPPSRVRLSASSGGATQSGEVHVFVR